MIRSGTWRPLRTSRRGRAKETRARRALPPLPPQLPCSLLASLPRVARTIPVARRVRQRSARRWLVTCRGLFTILPWHVRSEMPPKRPSFDAIADLLTSDRMIGAVLGTTTSTPRTGRDPRRNAACGAASSRLCRTAQALPAGQGRAARCGSQGTHARARDSAVKAAYGGAVSPAGTSNSGGALNAARRAELAANASLLGRFLPRWEETSCSQAASGSTSAPWRR